MSGLNLNGLWALAKDQAEIEAQQLFPPHMSMERRMAVDRLTWKYYGQYITPPASRGQGEQDHN